MPQPHSFTSPSLLVTIPSHFLNLPPKNFTCKSMPQLQSLPSPRLLVLESKSFSRLPPQNLTCKSMPQLHRLPPPRLLGRRERLRSEHQSKEKNTRIAVDSFETIVSIEHVRFGCPHRHVILQITWVPNNCFWLLINVS